MPKSLVKVQKKISKKKGIANSLHENSRDAQKLRRACARSEKLEKLAAARAKANQPHLKRVAYFQEVAKAAVEPFNTEMVHGLIHSYLSRHHEEIAKLQSQRRPGRPSSTQEALLQQAVMSEDREYDGGFWIPNMQDEGNLRMLRGWNGEWTALSTVKYARLSRDGTMKESNFPPKGLS